MLTAVLKMPGISHSKDSSNTSMEIIAAKSSIAMTAPVSQQKNSEKISMTAPVSYAGFYPGPIVLPSLCLLNIHMETIPRPSGSNGKNKKRKKAKQWQPINIPGTWQ